MSVPVFNPQTHLFGLQAVSHEVFDPSDRYRLFAQKIYPLLVKARPALEKCYCEDNGRPGVEPVLLLGVSVLQFLERVPDHPTNSARAESRTGRRPMLMSALSPVPTPTKTLPGAISSIVSNALAVTVKWRVKALVTRGPSLILLVA